MVEGTRKGIAVHLPKLRDLVAQVLADEDASETLRIHARTALLYCEGARYVQEFTHEYSWQVPAGDGSSRRCRKDVRRSQFRPRQMDG